MDWWDWVRWAGTSLIAVGALVLGIRAELRQRYSEHWVVTDGHSTRFINRTGEDAQRVHVEVFGGHVGAGRPLQDHVTADGEFKLVLVPADGAEIAYRISWTRPRTGKRHHLASRGAPPLKRVPEAATPWTESRP